MNEAWDDGLGVVGVYVDRLKDLDGNQTTKGANPFEVPTVGSGEQTVSSLVTAYDPTLHR